jgi:hypothetical protein
MRRVHPWVSFKYRFSRLLGISKKLPLVGSRNESARIAWLEETLKQIPPAL